MVVIAKLFRSQIRRNVRKLECECTGSGTCKETYIDGSYHPSIFTVPARSQPVYSHLYVVWK